MSKTVRIRVRGNLAITFIINFEGVLWLEKRKIGINNQGGTKLGDFFTFCPYLLWLPFDTFPLALGAKETPSEWLAGSGTSFVKILVTGSKEEIR